MKQKFALVLGLLLAFSMQAIAQDFESATDAVKNMGIGWNLGNTLDANNQTISDFSDPGYWGQQGLDSETCWGQPKTTREFIKMMKAAGFTAIRVPVTWYNHMNSDYEVDGQWMLRVKEIVDYVIDEGLYCIINVHHDTGADSFDDNGKLTGYHWLKADADNYNKNNVIYVALWAQIALTFKDYGEKLLFEGFNEILDANSCWNYPSWSASGDYNEDYAKKAYQAVNDYNSMFVSTVRITGGNNATRNLIVNTYAASSGGIWGNNKHPQEPLEYMELPVDGTPGHLIFEVHRYPNIQNGLANAKKDVDATIESLNTILKPKGAPVIFGEWGTSNVDNGSDYIDRRQSMIEFCDYFVKQCKANDIATFYWMGLSDGSARSQLVFNQPDLAEAITKAYHGDDFQGEYPAMEVADETVIFEGEKQLEWGEAIQFPATLFTNLSSTSTVEVTYTEKFDQFSGDEANSYLQFWYNDWSSMINFMADGQEISETLEVNKFYNSTSGTDHTTVFSFDKETFNNFKKKGMLFQGHGVLLKKVVLKAGEKDPDEGGESETFWEGNEMLDWGDGLQLTVPAEEFSKYGKDVVLGLSYTIAMNGDSDYNMIQLFYGDWKSNPSFIINGKEISKEYNPTAVHGLQNGDDGTSELTFSEAVYKELTEKGMAIQGHGLRLKKVTLGKSGDTGIQGVVKATVNDGVIYNLAGQRVTNPKKGIYIMNGKKIVIK
jgi:hypothetical protein